MKLDQETTRRIFGASQAKKQGREDVLFDCCCFGFGIRSCERYFLLDVTVRHCTQRLHCIPLQSCLVVSSTFLLKYVSIYRL